MKTNKKREQFEIANVLFEMGLDFNVIEVISGVSPQELLMEKIDMIEYDDSVKGNIESTLDNENKKEE